MRLCAFDSGRHWFAMALDGGKYCRNYAYKIRLCIRSENIECFAPIRGGKHMEIPLAPSMRGSP